RQLGIQQVARRQVKPDTDLPPCALPRRALAHRALEHPKRDRTDVASLFGKRDEVHRRHEAALWMYPAHQRLDAERGGRAKIVLGLVVEHQLVGLHRLAQFGEQGQPSGVAAVMRGVVQTMTGMGALGLVHGHVGAPHQFTGIAAMIGVKGDANAGAHVDH
ncbi:hypothetical protein RZS08_14580, partial [Arthrospira platensis SPKY1]|nr:hypothetical protein [Arthrospira platensis SPKY1]